MRRSLRFLVPLMLAMAGFTYLAAPLADALMQRRFVRDLDIRSTLITSAFTEQLSGLIEAGSAIPIVAL